MRWLLLLLALPVAFACISINSSALVNSSTTLAPSDCLFIEDLNATVNVTDLHLNDVVNITASGNVTNAATNTTYRCNYDTIGMNKTLNFSDSYIDPLHQVFIYAPDFPKINRVMTIRGGDIASEDFAAYNLTVNCQQRPYDTSLALDFNQTYSNNETNETFTCPAYPTLNISRAMGWGENFTNAALNLSLQSPAYPNLGVNKSLKCGQVFSVPNLSVSVEAPDCINMNRTFDFGQSLALPDYNASFAAPDKLNQNVVLNDGQNYSNSTAGLLVSCQATTAQYLSFCTNISDRNLTQTWQAMNLTNYSCNNLAYVCIDNLSDMCTPEEKFGGPNRLLECVNRVTLQTASTCNSTVDQLHICQTQQAQLQAATNTTNNAAEGFSSGALLLVSGVGAIALLVVCTYVYVTKKQKDAGDFR